MNDSQMIGAPMGGGDEIRELTRLLPPPPVPELPGGRMLALRAHLVAEVASEQRGAAHAPGGAPAQHRSAQRRPRRRGWLVAGLTGAVAAGAAVVIGVSALGSSGPTGGASPAAATLLAKIATAAARQPEPKVSDSEFVYIRSQEGSGTREVWSSVAHTTACVRSLAISDGKRLWIGASPGDLAANGIKPDCKSTGTVNDPTYRFLQSLPTDPRALLNFIYDKSQGEGQALGRDGEAFITIGDMIRDSIVPPQTAAALYRAAALIPGVSVVGPATNVVGRPGVAVAWTQGDTHQTYEWIFDAKTSQFIGEQDSDGTKIAILQRAFVARVGQLPPKASK